MKFKSFMSNSHFAVSVALMWHRIGVVQVNLCQKHLFLYQLTHNMTKDCTFIYHFRTWKLQNQNMGRTCCVDKLFWMSKQKTICVHTMFSPCSDLVVFMYWTGKSKNNLLSYCGLVDARIEASNKYLPVLPWPKLPWHFQFKTFDVEIRQWYR